MPPIDLGRRHKYGISSAAARTIDGIRFDSKAEATRYSELRLLRNAGEISDLELQPRFRIEINGIKVCDYVADFRYRDAAGRDIVEDVKGVRTAEYRLKKKLVRAIHGINIREV